ncbi:hypothetical protein [Terrilactibacillus laevilacticus]|uniref:hypothetical protein n=1 Tax=Terrilactibacillus laevilacticus TaxID=1380157 RepID=UPI0011476798|nr:hypothetical protein [Terrilactibacillus laevilacticus]
MSRSSPPAQFLFFLKRERGVQESLPRHYVTLVKARSIEQAVKRFEKMYRATYSGLFKVNAHTYHVFYSKGEGDYLEETMYQVTLYEDG